MTQEEWNAKQRAYIEGLKKKGVMETELVYACWFCKDTSQCTEACENPQFVRGSNAPKDQK